jgi:predicted AAA+ superfamily ATPase
LLANLFGQQFRQCLRLDFLERPAFAQAFDGALTSTTVLANLQLLTGQSFNPETDLLILDEIGECPRAVTSLKYFAEQMPQAFVAASGSNIGLLNAFPVGKVEQHCLRPLSFHEFLMAGNQPALLEAYETRNRSGVAHQLLMQQLIDYYFTGGMPAAVAAWFNGTELEILERTDQVKRIHADLIQGYRRDFGKYAGKTNAQVIDAVFTQVPAQISSAIDESVKRFRFKDILPPKSRYADFENAIDWLHQCRLILLNYPVEGQPRAPLVAYRKSSRLKLFLFDTGLLHHMLGADYHQIRQQAYEYKGFVAENFVQQELAAQGLEPTHAWVEARAEIEFLLTNGLGRIVPVEVKSGTRTKAKSLASYINRYHPAIAIKLAATPGNLIGDAIRDDLASSTKPGSSAHGTQTATANWNLPLYDAALLPSLINSAT